MKSWRTTVGGLVALVVALLVCIVQPLMDDDPKTMPKWEAFGTALTTAWIGFAARDHSVSSEDAGLKP